MIALQIEVDDAPDGIAELLNRVSVACCSEEGIPEAAAFARLVDDQAIRQINMAFRGVDRATDVLSFPSVAYPAGKTARDCLKRLARERDPESGLSCLGDLVISLPRAAEQAREYGHSLMRELGYLTAHAMFHLMGYDHVNDEDRRAMRFCEERVMASLHLSR